MTIREANKPFSDGLRAYLADNGIRQSFVAGKAGKPLDYVSDCLNGRRLIRASDMDAFARILHVDVGVLFAMGKDERVREEGGRPGGLSGAEALTI